MGGGMIASIMKKILLLLGFVVANTFCAFGGDSYPENLKDDLCSLLLLLPEQDFYDVLVKITKFSGLERKTMEEFYEAIKANEVIVLETSNKQMLRILFDFMDKRFLKKIAENKLDLSARFGYVPPAIWQQVPILFYKYLEFELVLKICKLFKTSRSSYELIEKNMSPAFCKKLDEHISFIELRYLCSGKLPSGLL